MHAPLPTVLCSMALSLTASLAAAGENPPEAPTPATASRAAFGLNPLALAIGRLSGDFEYLAAPHNVLVVNLHADYASHDLPALEYDRIAPVWGFGGELGWRWFPANSGMHGVFFGLSFLADYYNADYRGRRIDLPGAGVAGDFGWQYDVGAHVFVAFGFGLQYLWTLRYPADIAPGVSFVMGAGVDPRLLFTVGGRFR